MHKKIKGFIIAILFIFLCFIGFFIIFTLGSLEGTIKGENGNSLSGVKITGTYDTYTDENGKFKIFFPPFMKELKFQKAGFQQQKFQITRLNEENLIATLILLKYQDLLSFIESSIYKNRYSIILRSNEKKSSNEKLLTEIMSEFDGETYHYFFRTLKNEKSIFFQEGFMSKGKYFLRKEENGSLKQLDKEAFAKEVNFLSPDEAIAMFFPLDFKNSYPLYKTEKDLSKFIFSSVYDKVSFDIEIKLQDDFKVVEAMVKKIEDDEVVLESQLIIKYLEKQIRIK